MLSPGQSLKWPQWPVCSSTAKRTNGTYRDKTKCNPHIRSMGLHRGGNCSSEQQGKRHHYGKAFLRACGTQEGTEDSTKSGPKLRTQGQASRCLSTLTGREVTHTEVFLSNSTKREKTHETRQYWRLGNYFINQPAPPPPPPPSQSLRDGEAPSAPAPALPAGQGGPRRAPAAAPHLVPEQPLLGRTADRAVPGGGPRCHTAAAAAAAAPLLPSSGVRPLRSAPLRSAPPAGAGPGPGRPTSAPPPGPGRARGQGQGRGWPGGLGSARRRPEGAGRPGGCRVVSCSPPGGKREDRGGGGEPRLSPALARPVAPTAPGSAERGGARSRALTAETGWRARLALRLPSCRLLLSVRARSKPRLFEKQRDFSWALGWGYLGFFLKSVQMRDDLGRTLIGDKDYKQNTDMESPT